MEKERRQYRFEPFGPFDLPQQGHAMIAADKLKDFWGALASDHPGLPDAIGCYIFGIRIGSSTLPWYVGKTERTSFRSETVQPHKLLVYARALGQARGGFPVLFLLPRMNESGKFRRARKSGSISVDRLERMLIGTALLRNANLLNLRSTKQHTQTVVPGYLNEPVGSRSPQAKRLAALLGTRRRKIARDE